MAKKKSQSPVFDQVIDAVFQAMKEDDAIDEKFAQRTIDLLRSESAPTANKIREAMFPETPKENSEVVT